MKESGLFRENNLLGLKPISGNFHLEFDHFFKFVDGCPDEVVIFDFIVVDPAKATFD